MSEHEPIPGSVFNPRQVRTLKIVVIVMTILLVLGFALLVAGLYYEATKMGSQREAGQPGSDQAVQRGTDGGEVTLPVPAGAQIKRILADSGRVILHLNGRNGEEIVIVDTTRGNAVTRVRLAPR